MSEKQARPTLDAYTETHEGVYDLFPECEEIPVGKIGAGKVERLFCPLAQERERGKEVPTERVAMCEQFLGGYCGLTQYRHRCLFVDLGSPQWATIACSIAIERGKSC